MTVSGLGTTDVAWIDDDGFVWIEGRSDDAIVRGGFKVFPKEITDVLRSHREVLDAGVTGIDDDRLGARARGRKAGLKG